VQRLAGIALARSTGTLQARAIVALGNTGFAVHISARDYW
jgi:hypothetical protein